MRLSTLLAALLVAPGLFAEGAPAPAEAAGSPSPAQRIYYTQGGSVQSDFRVEYTDQGAVVHFTGKMVLRGRPMSEREQALRTEYIQLVPLGDAEPTPAEQDRLERISAILERTSPASAMDPMRRALSQAFDDWKSPMRFEALYLDPAVPQVPVDAD